MKSSLFRPAVGRPRFSRIALAALLTAGAMTVVPVAQADSLTAVRSHVHAADRVLHNVVAAAASGSISSPLAELRQQLHAARHAGMALNGRAHTPAVRVRAATALTKIAAQESRDATALTPLLGQLTGSGESDLAGFVASVTQAREQALGVVTQLIGQLPTGAKGQLAGVVAQLSGTGAGQIGALAGAISPGSLACPVLDAVSQVVTTVLTSVQSDLSRVQSLLALLPAGAAGQLTGIIDGLPTQLSALVTRIKGALDCPAATTTTGGSAGHSTGGLLGGIGGLVGSRAGAITGVVGSTVGAVTGVIGGALQLVTGLLGGSGGGLLGFGG